MIGKLINSFVYTGVSMMVPDAHLARGGYGSEIENRSYFKIIYSTQI